MNSVSKGEVKGYRSPAEQNWLVWFDDRWRARSPRTRAIVSAYFRPARFEILGNGYIYRALGIKFVAYFIPTGGLFWRKLFNWDGWTFALRAGTIGMAREYRYSTCVFEMLHISVILLMLPAGIDSFRSGYADGILKFVIAGLLMNGYPLMLQRYNRVRIQILSEKYRRSHQKREKKQQNE